MFTVHITVVSLHHYNKYSAWFLDIRIYQLVYLDQLSIIIKSTLNPVISEGETVQFIVIASGVNKHKFKYQWKRRDKSLPQKALGITNTTLTIVNLVEADEGKYYCTVTNQWKKKVHSQDVTLTVQGNNIS